MTIDELLTKYRALDSKVDCGKAFERLMKNFLLTYPEYRKKFSAELKKSLPRIILSDRFWEFSRAGRDLAEIHLNYEHQPPAEVQCVMRNGNFPR